MIDVDRLAALLKDALPAGSDVTTVRRWDHEQPSLIVVVDSLGSSYALTIEQLI